jgi:hypothetical protein
MLREDRGAQVLLVAVVALAAVLVGALWIVDYVPTSDGPNHVLAGYLSAHLHDAGSGYDAFVEPGSPISSLAFHATFAALSRLMPWRDALRVALSLGALLWAFGFASVVLALRRDRAHVGLLGFATALSWTFYMGLFSYWMTLGIDLVVLGFVLRCPSPTVRERAAVGAGLLVAMVGHSFAAMLLGFMLGVVALVRPGPRGRPRELLALALVSAPSLVLAYLSARGATGVSAAQLGAPAVLRPTWLGWRDRVDILWQCFTGGPAWRGLVPILVALVGVGSTAARARRGRASREEVALAILAAAFLAAVLLSPIHLGNVWQDVAPRFLPLGASLGLALVPIEELTRRRDRAVARGAIALFAFAATGWSWIHHAKLSLASADAMAVLAAKVRRSGARLPIVLTPPDGSVAQVDENVLIGDLFAVEQGGMTPYLYAIRPAMHPFVWRLPRSELFPPFPSQFYGQAVRDASTDPTVPPRPVQLASLARTGSAFEDVILWGTPADVRAFEARGYVADAKQGGAAILRFSPCGLDVDVDLGVPAPGLPLVVEYGWAPLVESAGARRWPNVTELSEGRAHTRFVDAPCGPVWVRAFRDDDGSGDASAGEPVCRGADAGGRLHAIVTRDGGAVRCDLARPFL